VTSDNSTSDPNTDPNTDPDTYAGTHPDDLPDASIFWRWARESTRPLVGWILLGLGATFIIVGYFGVSREALVAKQIPFVISGGVGGMTLVAIGAFLLGTEDLRGRLDRLTKVEEMVEDLHSVLLTVVDEDTSTTTSTPATTRPASTKTKGNRRSSRATANA